MNTQWTRRRFVTAASVGAASLGLDLIAPVTTTAAERTFPQRPITFIVPYPAGGSGDYIARIVAAGLSQRWKQSVIVQNRPGAGGVIGVSVAAKTPPDGYTVVLNTASVTLTLAEQAHPSLDLFRDIDPVSLIAVAPMVLVAGKDAKIETVTELAKHSQQQKGGFFYGGTGAGGVGNLAMELIKKPLGIDLTYVPYQGGAASIAAVIANQIPLAINDVGNALPFIRSGTLKPLLIASPKRFSLLPDVPALDELGVRNIDVKASLGLAAPKGTPTAITEAFAAEIQKVLQQPDVQNRFHISGLEPVGTTPQGYADFLKKEDQQFRQGVKVTGMHLDD